MTFDAGQAALLRPTAVAVHDDRHVLRQRSFGLGRQMRSGGTHFLNRRLRGLPEFKNEKIELLPSRLFGK
jgi:hypothetical protein